MGRTELRIELLGLSLPSNATGTNDGVLVHVCYVEKMRI
jgi:hypothetical protein